MARNHAPGYTAAMVSRGFTLFLALLRIAAGLSLLLAGLHKLSWFAHPEALQHQLTEWSAHPANPVVAKYLVFIAPHFGLPAVRRRFE